MDSCDVSIMLHTRYVNPRNAEALWEDHLSDTVLLASTEVSGCSSSAADGGDLAVTLKVRFDDPELAEEYVRDVLVPVMTSYPVDVSGKDSTEFDELDDPADAKAAGNYPVSGVTVSGAQLAEQ